MGVPIIKVAYICDKKKDCGRFGNCGELCNHTFDDLHAKNGIVQSINELETKRFKLVCTSNECAYYEEVLPKRRKQK